MTAVRVVYWPPDQVEFAAILCRPSESVVCTCIRAQPCELEMARRVGIRGRRVMSELSSGCAWNSWGTCATEPAVAWHERIPWDNDEEARVGKRGGESALLVVGTTAGLVVRVGRTR